MKKKELNNKTNKKKVVVLPSCKPIIYVKKIK